MTHSIRLLIHGGAGTIRRSELTAEKEAALHQALKGALQAGFNVLQAGESSLSAVVAAVAALENAELFNAGYGSVLTEKGTVELDAAVMDGKNLKAGAVAGISCIRNPVLLAREVMEHSQHVMLIGSQVEEFAKSRGIALINPKELISPRQLHKWQTLKDKPKHLLSDDDKHGTVGAVAIDVHGNLASATSTGGIMYKMPGRVGDSPIIGAGTYADETCAVSATGQGEYFMRLLIAYDISARMRYQKLNLTEATKAAIQRLTELGGEGGVIALDREANVCMPFNTAGMYRGCIDASGSKTDIF